MTIVAASHCNMLVQPLPNPQHTKKITSVKSFSVVFRRISCTILHCIHFPILALCSLEYAESTHYTVHTYVTSLQQR